MHTMQQERGSNPPIALFTNNLPPNPIEYLCTICYNHLLSASSSQDPGDHGTNHQISLNCHAFSYLLLAQLNICSSFKLHGFLVKEMKCQPHFKINLLQNHLCILFQAEAHEGQFWHMVKNQPESCHVTEECAGTFSAVSHQPTLHKVNPQFNRLLGKEVS